MARTDVTADEIEFMAEKLEQARKTLLEIAKDLREREPHSVSVHAEDMRNKLVPGVAKWANKVVSELNEQRDTYVFTQRQDRKKAKRKK